jgi:cytochrome c553
MQIKIISALAIMVMVTYACKKTSTNPDYAADAVCSGTTPTYTANVQSILNTNCATSGCHSAASSKAGVNLSDFASASSQFKSNSKNLASVHHGSGVEAMPKNASKLSDADINKLDCWVKNGCPQ